MLLFALGSRCGGSHLSAVALLALPPPLHPQLQLHRLLQQAATILCLACLSHPAPLQPQLHRTRELAAAATTNVVLAQAAVVVPRLGGSLCVAVEVRWCVGLGGWVAGW